MLLKIGRDIDTPVYRQIFEQVRRQILSGEIMPGYRLPPERKLAESLGVNRTTDLITLKVFYGFISNIYLYGYMY